MWLLDVNIPRQLALLLEGLGITAETALARGWDTLNNGLLLENAAAAGFHCLLTRDRLFGESASKALKQFPAFSVVLITLPQLRAQKFLDDFRSAWNKAPIVPIPGTVVRWPDS
jgi:hypothetical protein